MPQRLPDVQFESRFEQDQNEREYVEALRHALKFRGIDHVEQRAGDLSDYPTQSLGRSASGETGGNRVP